MKEELPIHVIKHIMNTERGNWLHLTPERVQILQQYIRSIDEIIKDGENKTLVDLDQLLVYREVYNDWLTFGGILRRMFQDVEDQDKSPNPPTEYNENDYKTWERLSIGHSKKALL